jgi:hypothetical protein
LLSNFSIQQWNSLIRGTGLAAELPPSSSENYAFIVVHVVNPTPYINTAKERDLKFWIRKYEVPTIYVDEDLDVSDDELINSIHIKNILGREMLEKELSNHISDYSCLVPEWKCNNPL